MLRQREKQWTCDQSIRSVMPRTAACSFGYLAEEIWSQKGYPSRAGISCVKIQKDEKYQLAISEALGDLVEIIEDGFPDRLAHRIVLPARFWQSAKTLG